MAELVGGSIIGEEDNKGEIWPIVKQQFVTRHYAM